jgi:hypothetical protein
VASTQGEPGGGFEGASNKPQTLPNSIIPFIDKLSVTLCILKEHRPIFDQNLHAADNVKSIFQSAKNDPRYKITRNLSLASCAGHLRRENQRARAAHRSIRSDSIVSQQMRRNLGELSLKELTSSLERRSNRTQVSS